MLTSWSAAHQSSAGWQTVPSLHREHGWDVILSDVPWGIVPARGRRPERLRKSQVHPFIRPFGAIASPVPFNSRAPSADDIGATSLATARPRSREKINPIRWTGFLHSIWNQVMNSAIDISPTNTLPRDEYGALDLHPVLSAELLTQVSALLNDAVKAEHLPRPFIVGGAKE